MFKRFAKMGGATLAAGGAVYAWNNSNIETFLDFGPFVIVSVFFGHRFVGRLIFNRTVLGRLQRVQTVIVRNSDKSQNNFFTNWLRKKRYVRAEKDIKKVQHVSADANINKLCKKYLEILESKN